MEIKSDRQFEIDLLRSIAIVIMLYANSFPYLAGFEPSSFIRVLMSLAAPLFIFLSGASSVLRSNDIRKNILGSFSVIITASMIDFFIWGILPFYSFDVLYVIGIGGIINSFTKNNSKLLLTFTIVCVLIGSLITYIIPYELELKDVGINEFSNYKITDALKNLACKGWFPVFPWLAFAFIGKLYALNKELINKKLFQYFWIILSLTILFYVINSKTITQPSRDGYIEIFYPPSAKFLVLAISWILTLIPITIFICKNFKSNLILLIGQCSLVVYIIHAVINSCFFSNSTVKYNQINYFLIFSFLFIWFTLFSRFLIFLRNFNIIKKCPYLIRKITGL